MEADSSARWDTVIVWFRRDLRVTDHPALMDAVAHARAVVPLFVLDPRLVEGSMASPARIRFLRGSLVALDDALRARGSGLLLGEGKPEEVIPAVASELGAGAVLATRDVTPYSHRRDHAVTKALEAADRRLHLRPGLLLAEPEEMLTSGGAPYVVFSPFWRALQRAPRRELLGPPDSIPTPADIAGRSRRQLRAMAEGDPPLGWLPEPGEAAAAGRLERWVAHGLADYERTRNDLSGDGTSGLSADLHLGLLSPLQVESATVAATGPAATPFVRQIAWREFYHHALYHRRRVPDHAFDDSLMAAFRGERDDPEAVAAWREGRTGVPVVDAAMRQLAMTGWLSNRARLVVASFLTRHLLMDYRIGEAHFLRSLIDGDIANNLGGWQWTAGVGSDPQPWFRIFNPVLQGRRFDPAGDWVRRWVPELADVPTKHVHAPWEMDRDVAAEVGLRWGETYPRPIVDIKEGRERALAAFREATGREA